MNKSIDTYDVAVVGGGPGGYSAAIHAAQLGGRVILFEQEKLGGTCLNVGCIPTKYLLEKAALLERIARDTQSGVFRDAGLYSWRKIQSGKDAAVKRLVSGVEGLMRSWGVTVVKGRASVRRAGEVESQDGAVHAARGIILATGSRPLMPPIPGIDSRFVLDSTGALSLGSVPRRLVVIGGGVIGLEFASIYNAMGSEVTVLEMLPGLLANEDGELASALGREMGRRGVRIHTGVRVEEIAEAGEGCSVRCGKGGETSEFRAEAVLIAAGRRPNLEGVDVPALGLALDGRGNIAVNRRQETSVPGVYAVGDATGGFQLAHTAYAEAEAAAANCMGGHREADLGVVPRCIYSIPQAAAVGATEEELLRQGVSYLKGLVPYASSGKALASEEPEGFVKALCDKETGRLLGVHMLGSHATELLAAALAAMNLHATVDDFGGMIFPHPTLSELVKEAALACKGQALHYRHP